jgi:hypothetical protein
MSRLNIATREYILDKALEKADFPALQVKYSKDRDSWFDRLRIETNGMADAELEALDAKIQKLKAQIPEGLRSNYRVIEKRSSMYPNIGGLRIGRYEFPNVDGKHARYAVSEPTIASTHPLAVEFHAMEDAHHEVCERTKVLTAQVMSVINSVTTIKKLIEVWPEARELLPPNEQPIISNLPAVLISSLNAAIGLPSEEIAA